MSLTISEIQNRLPNQVTKINSKAVYIHNSSGVPVGYIHQDKTRIIYVCYIWNGITNKLTSAEFLSYFKHRLLLTIRDNPICTRYIYALQR